MDKQTGKATYKLEKFYFDDAGWAIVKEAARTTKKSPTYVVTAALKRYSRVYGKKS